MKKRDLVLKFSIYALIMLVCYLLQTAVFPRLAIGGVKPLILPVFVVCTSLYEGSLTGSVYGLLSGLMCDVSMSGNVAMFTILLTVVGALVGVMAERFLARSLPSVVLCSLVCLALSAVFQTFSFIFYVGVPITSVASIAIWQTLYSVVFVLPVWAAVHTVFNRFRKANT